MSRTGMFTIGSLLVLAISAAFEAIYASSEPTQQILLQTEIAKTLLDLALVGIVAMAAKAGVDAYLATEQHKRESAEEDKRQMRENLKLADEQMKANHALRVKALATLTTSYWNIKKSLKLIETNRSALTYGQQMALVMNGRLELQQLDNEIMAGTLALSSTNEICAALTELEGHLARACDEWRDKYLQLSHQQKADELVPPEQKKVPEQLEALVALASVRAKGFEAIHRPFETAANLIRRQVFPLPRESASPALVESKQS